jgi:hypothetical protein
MAKEERILDKTGKYLGTVFIDSKGDKRLLGRTTLLGSYKADNNTTYDHVGKVFARSDQLLRLIDRH